MTRFTRLSSALAIAGATAALMLGGVAGASAKTLPTPEASPPAVCWHEQITGREACAETREALADAVLLTYGLRILGPDAEPAAAAAYSPSPAALKQVADQQVESRSSGPITPQATYVIGAFYMNASYGGSSYLVTTGQTSNPCAQAGSYTYGYGNLTLGWNDAVSSFQGYGHCGFRLFADASWTGSTYGPYFQKASLGPFNNIASSYDTHKID